MRTRSLGRSELRLSEIALGTWGLGAGSYGKVMPERFRETVAVAIEKGITTFDLAPTWGDAERVVGSMVKDAKVDATLITRGGARFTDGVLAHAFDKASLIADCERSLERLGVEQIHVWLLHNPDEEVLGQDDFKEAVDTLATDGKIGAWGASVGTADQARLAIAAGAEAICVPHNLFSTALLDDLASDIASAGCGVLARSPLMYGLLAGQWGTTRRFSPDDHRVRRWSRGALTSRVREIDSLRFLVGENHRDLATAALRFVLTHNAVTCALVGARTPYQVAAAVEAAEGPPYLSDDEMMRLAKLKR
jgi:aryl-alcohol dehydrogenase-like predicted oxidoreductase